MALKPESTGRELREQRIPGGFARPRRTTPDPSMAGGSCVL